MSKKMLFIFTFIFLIACNEASSNNKTMAGKKVRAVPNVNKTVETRRPSYRVFGRPYFVMKSSKNYEEKGIASWYGSQFHRRFTSSGERYNMFHMTAAHKTLPLSTYVLVTNLMNGRKVVVKVNDRGPFVSNRIIDLSYAAAKKLGMVGLGIVRVNVKAISSHHLA